MKKGFLRFFGILLTIAMIVNMIPVSGFATEYGEDDAQSLEDSLDATYLPEEDGTVTEELCILGEVEENRTEFTKEFALNGGLRMAVVYPDAVHYQEDGQWREIDNTLQVCNGAYTNTAGCWDIRLPQQMTGDSPISITKDGYTLEFRMAGELCQTGDLAAMSTVSEGCATVSPQTAEAQVQPMAEAEADVGAEEQIFEKLQSRLTYANVYQGTSVVYDLDSNRLKESIIIQQYSASLQGYLYLLNVGQLVPVLDASGQIDFYDEEQNRIVMVMPAPYLLDGEEAFCDDVEVLLEPVGDGIYALTYLLPQSWLADEDRVWPVVLDPVVFAKSSTRNISDRGISEHKNFGYTDTTMECGYDLEYGIERFFIKFNELPELTWEDLLVGATMRLCKPQNSDTTVSVEVHKVNGTWESSTLTWSNKPSFDTIVSDYALVKDAGYYTWDVTDIVRGWYSGTNTGMMFKASDEVESAGADNWKQFYTSDYSDDSNSSPILTILYRNCVGIEPYYTYAAMGVGSAGTAYIADYSGQLKVSKSILSYASTVNPFTLALNYNSDYFFMNNGEAYQPPEELGLSMRVGAGFTLNAIQKLETEVISNTTYLKYTDGDGTVHYFRKDANKDATGT